MLKLRELRKERGLTQQQIADRVGVLNVSISNYERRIQMPDITTLTKIANVLGVSTDTLLGLNDQPDDTSARKHLKQGFLHLALTSFRKRRGNRH